MAKRKRNQEAVSDVAVAEKKEDREPSDELNQDPTVLPQTNAGRGKKHDMTETVRDLERINKELTVRIKELELEQVIDRAAPGEGGGEDYAESTSIISMVDDLHREIDLALELKDALETDLAEAQKKLSAEAAVRTELEARIELLDAKVALGDQLRDDIAFVEEERNRIARRLEEVTSELEPITAERDGLLEQRNTDKARIEELQGIRIDHEAQVLNLKENVADMGRLRDELADVKEGRQVLEENVQDLSSKLEATDTAKIALELELATNREIVRGQNKQIEELQDTLTTTDAKMVDLHAQYSKQKGEHTILLESNKRLEREFKLSEARSESLKKELDASKHALHNIHSATKRTTSRIRERYAEAAVHEQA